MRKYCVLGGVLLAAIVTIDLASAQNPPSNPVIVKKDPALDALISPDARLEKIAGGFGFTEGALWVPKGEGGYLLFADMPAKLIYQWTPDGQVSIFIGKCGHPAPHIWRAGSIQRNG